MKVSIHVNSQHLSQMVSQISHTYDFDRKFMEKRCGLSASLYGNYISSSYHLALLLIMAPLVFRTAISLSSSFSILTSFARELFSGVTSIHKFVSSNF